MGRFCCFLMVSGAALAPAQVNAHGEGIPIHTPFWATWSWEPGVVLSLIACGWLYARGLWTVWRVAGVGHGIRRWEAAAFAAGWLSLWIALVSPLHRLGGILFSAHMAQHELLMLVAAPLLVISQPLITFLWGVPLIWRRTVGGWSTYRGIRRGWRILTNPATAWTLQAAALWAWHAPVFFQATLQSELVHTLQHLSFFCTALLFWWVINTSHQRRLSYGAAILMVFTTSLHSGALGAILTFSTTVWYPIYGQTVGQWGCTPLEDQQLGGLLMWIPAGVVYLFAGLALGASWLHAPALSSGQEERKGLEGEKDRLALPIEASPGIFFLALGLGFSIVTRV